MARAAIGGAMGGGAGATALAGDAFNRQLHPNEIKLITSEPAAKYAADHPGMSESDAETILIKQTLRQVDDAWATKLGPDDQDAKQWLAANTPAWAMQQGYFTATAAERADPTINGQYYDEAFHNHLTWNSFLADVQGSFGGDDSSPAHHGSMVALDGYKDVANQLRDQGTVESLLRKVASGQMLTDEEVNTYIHLATLYPMLKAGALGPVGQLGMGIRDGDSGAVAAAILAGVPGESAAAAAGKAADATADTLKANVLKNIAESQAARSTVVSDQTITKVLASYGPLSEGPLPTIIANTFRSGTYSEVITQEPMILYRVYGGSANELGAYWTTTPPSGPLQSIIDSALDQNWGNTATNIVKIQVPAGTKFFEGIAAEQRGLVGGGNQVLFPKDVKIDPSWAIKQ